MIDFFPDLQQQLDKLSIYKKPMQFQITEIELDFEDSQGVEVSFEIYFDNMSETWCDSGHPQDIGPGQGIKAKTSATQMILEYGDDGFVSPNLPPSIPIFTIILYFR